MYLLLVQTSVFFSECAVVGRATSIKDAREKARQYKAENEGIEVSIVAIIEIV
jgi:hypothetical protein